ncbi:thioredoxin [Candidatus Woesearchaeota archaeon CG10_big_fil_rev_8_21_14_0_10_44_13]|nr:MAG: thioredoxin [Candidatus Woesearchaeota archaeon CG10_big_fil_rev_8_21_14_0_10_44_13]
MESLNSENFDDRTKGMCIVDFWAEWCGPCKMLGPVFEQLSKDYKGKLNFFKVNTEEASDIAERFSVMSIPCLIVMKDGQEMGRVVGYMPKDSLKRKIDGIVK